MANGEFHAADDPLGVKWDGFLTSISSDPLVLPRSVARVWSVETGIDITHVSAEYRAQFACELKTWLTRDHRTWL